MNYMEVLRSRSFSKAPAKTTWRCIQWGTTAAVGNAPTFSVDFGPHRFRMRLQTTKAKFGSNGIFIQRQYYEPLLEFGHKLLSKGGNAIDGGANQGIYSCAFAAAVGPQGTVYAFEPQQYAVACIAEHIRLNGFRNIVVFEGGLSNVDGDAFLNFDQGAVSGFITEAAKGQNVVRVMTYTVNSLLSNNQLEQVQFIKLDVEGSELRALQGASRMFKSEKPTICIEANSRVEYDKIAEYLGQFGYQPYLFDFKGNLIRFSKFAPSANVFFAA